MSGKLPPTTGLAKIIGVAGEAPEQALIGAVIFVAIADARAGSAEAATWVRGPKCREWLQWITPPDVDTDDLHARLVAGLPGGAYQAPLDLDGDAA